MALPMEQLDIFRIPVFKFKFEDSEKYKDEWVKFLDEYDRYPEFREAPNLKITEPQLHKKEIFNPLRAFITQCLYQYMRYCNMNLGIGITSMWGVKQPKEGYHHMHTHGNTFAAGVYYLHSDTKFTSGTRFNNVLSDFHLIRSAGIPSVSQEMYEQNKTSSYSSWHETIFEEGTLVLFPGWLRHDTRTHEGENRYVIGLNSMPIGMTDYESYDRYNFPDPATMKLYLD